MRGFPPLHLLIFMIGFGLFAVPLFQMTQGRTQIQPVVSESESLKNEEQVNGYLRVKFAHRPTELSFTIGEKVVVELKEFDGENHLEKEVTVPADPKVIEGLLHVKWSDETPETAVTLEWEPEGFHSTQTTVWGEVELDDVVTLVWK